MHLTFVHFANTMALRSLFTALMANKKTPIEVTVNTSVTEVNAQAEVSPPLQETAGQNESDSEVVVGIGAISSMPSSPSWSTDPLPSTTRDGHHDSEGGDKQDHQKKQKKNKSKGHSDRILESLVIEFDSEPRNLEEESLSWLAQDFSLGERFTERETVWN